MTGQAAAEPLAGTRPERRNPGPEWGYAVLSFADRILPEWICRPLRMLGTWIAVMSMPAERRHSRDYLRHVLDHEPRLLDVFRHFFAFQESLTLKFRVVNGRHHRCEMTPECTGFPEWLADGFPVLLGTFHIGVSDLLGFMLGGRHERRVSIVRLRVGNSDDTRRLGERFKDFIHFIWINEPGEMIFALKEAAETSSAIALQCDRVDFTARMEPFEFLGARRLFPFTIYHLSALLNRPVILSVGIQESATRSLLYDSPVFRVKPGERRSETLERARLHFQDFLHRIERLLKTHPYVWFNFTELNPEAPTEERCSKG